MVLSLYDSMRKLFTVDEFFVVATLLALPSLTCVSFRTPFRSACAVAYLALGVVYSLLLVESAYLRRSSRILKALYGVRSHSIAYSAAVSSLVLLTTSLALYGMNAWYFHDRLIEATTNVLFMASLVTLALFNLTLSVGLWSLGRLSDAFKSASLFRLFLPPAGPVVALAALESWKLSWVSEQERRSELVIALSKLTKVEEDLMKGVSVEEAIEEVVEALSALSKALGLSGPIEALEALSKITNKSEHIVILKVLKKCLRAGACDREYLLDGVRVIKELLRR